MPAQSGHAGREPRGLRSGREFQCVDDAGRPTRDELAANAACGQGREGSAIGRAAVNICEGIITPDANRTVVAAGCEGAVAKWNNSKNVAVVGASTAHACTALAVPQTNLAVRVAG